MAALASDWLRRFRLLLWNRWTEFNETWQEARSQRLLPSLCFSGRSDKQDGLTVLWLAETFSTSPLKPLNGIQRNLTGRKISTSSPNMFFGPIGKTRLPPWPLIGWDIFDFSYETAERNSTKLDRKQDINVLYQVCVFWDDRENKMAALASDLLRRFDFSSETAERNSMKLDRKQDLNVLYQVCVFRADRTKNKMAALASDWLRHFDFSSETAERNSTKLDRKQNLNVLYQVCGFRADRKIRWPPWPLLAWDIFDFSSETAERNSTKLDRKQDLNVLYQVCVFQAYWKNKMAALANPPKRWHIALRCMISGPLGLLYNLGSLLLLALQLWRILLDHFLSRPLRDIFS